MIEVIKDKEILEKLSKAYNEKVLSAQIWEDKIEKYVIVFYPHFAWFQKRFRISKKEYDYVIGNIEKEELYPKTKCCDSKIFHISSKFGTCSSCNKPVRV